MKTLQNLGGYDRLRGQETFRARRGFVMSWVASKKLATSKRGVKGGQGEGQIGGSRESLTQKWSGRRCHWGGENLLLDNI